MPAGQFSGKVLRTASAFASKPLGASKRWAPACNCHRLDRSTRHLAQGHRAPLGPIASASSRRITLAASSAMAQDLGTAPADSPRIVICGGGIIGCAVAYYLAKRGTPSTIVERGSIACASSGKAGGFLALDWNAGAVGDLAEHSYGLHADLARELGAERLGYRTVSTLAVSLSARPSRHKSGSKVPAWIDGSVVGSKMMGDESSTAQVHPEKLTKAFMEEAGKAGAKVHQGTVTGIKLSHDSTPRVQGVEVGGEVLPADVVVIAMGPWSKQAADWLPLPPVSGQKAHSVIIQPSSPITSHCLFTQISGTKSGNAEPELYPRPDGSVYICGESDSVGVPDDPLSIQPREDACDNLEAYAGMVSSALREGATVKRQACYLPLSPDGTPLIGAVPHVEGAFVATGHSCWGILNGPATGACLADLILDGSCSRVNMKAFSPSRFASRKARR
ncbi:hypothetical protein WJX74_006279 [Apatococcus lobatus]|uniref:FAD dependent oxidoreductase domain-containing protein n=1 Tax=Apatococcus lobatus TaxID=904363 RepID=A0AAW1SER9_9CHLO